MKDNRSVNRILAILELISQHEEGLTLGQIYRMLDMPKATAYDFLQTLYKVDAVYYKDPRLKNYVIGSKMFAIGSVYTKNSNLIEASNYELRKFADEYAKTVFIAKKVEGQFVYVYKYQPSNSLITTPFEIGTIVDNFSTHPVGIAFKLFASNYKHDASNIEVTKILKDGYVESNEHDFGHIHMIAIPIRNFENRVTGVISVADLYQENQNNEFVKREFLNIASKISKKLGYLGE